MVIFIVWIVFIYLEQNKPESPKIVRENRDLCNIILPSEDTKILEFNQYQISDKTRFIIYADFECLIDR